VPAGAYPVEVIVERTVTAQALVPFAGNHYSVPPGLPGAQVQVAVRLGQDTVRVITAGGATVAAHRRRPDGVDLRWEQIGLNEVSIDPQLPFFVHWHNPASEHPSAGGSRVTLRKLEIVGNETRIDEYLGTSARQPLDGVEVEFFDPLEDGTGVVAAVFDTALGSVRID